jgi:CO/xanthine dehydrogenase Mo-binding subunit
MTAAVWQSYHRFHAVVMADCNDRQSVKLVLRGGHAAKAFPEPMGPGEAAYPAAGAAIACQQATRDDVARLGLAPDGRPPQALLRSASRPG